MTVYTCADDDHLHQFVRSFSLEALVDLRLETKPLNLSIYSLRLAELIPAGTDRPSFTIWEEGPLRDYAGYMATSRFRRGVTQLLALASQRKTVVLGEDQVWFRCRRALLADYLKSRGHQVFHLLGPDQVEAHLYTAAALAGDNYGRVVLRLT